MKIGAVVPLDGKKYKVGFIGIGYYRLVDENNISRRSLMVKDAYRMFGVEYG